MTNKDKPSLSHVDEEGRVRMVDVGGKSVTKRQAEARGSVLMAPETISAIREHRTPKGDPLETARLAGIMAAKQTASLIPLCHPLPLTHVEVEITLDGDSAQIVATASTNGPTGVEMEAMTAVSVAALTLYDMCKAIDRLMTITEIRLEKKSVGRSGDWSRSADHRWTGSLEMSLVSRRRSRAPLLSCFPRTDVSGQLTTV